MRRKRCSATGTGLQTGLLPRPLLKEVVRTMKAIRYNRFGGPEVLEYVDVPVPSPDAGEVLIETRAVGVNFSDIRERLGIYNQKETRVGGVTLPQIGGVQVVGKVVDTGSAQLTRPPSFSSR